MILSSFSLVGLVSGFSTSLPTVAVPHAPRMTPICASHDRHGDDEMALLRLCALTDRGQRATAAQEAELRAQIERLEANAPDTDVLALNGEWRLLAACGETVYRSSPFFWAFRQCLAAATTPIAIPGAGVPAGGDLSSAVYGITDSIPFYDIGSAVQRISGLCGETIGCEVPTDDRGAGAVEQSEPSEGSDVPPPQVEIGQLVSQVELSIGRNFFGVFPSPQSLMTTTCSIKELAPPPEVKGTQTTVSTELRIETTAAAESSIAQVLPGLDGLLTFPSGDALDLIRSQSSRVTLLTTYLSPTLRISRPVIVEDEDKERDGVAGGAWSELDVENAAGPVFVYAREA
jgi:hypothetical protein